MEEVFAYAIAGLIVYIISILMKYVVKIGWAFINWVAEKYIAGVLNAEVTGEPMIDYTPVKEVLKIRKAIKNNGG
jgi:hypothetical protein